MNLRIPPDVIFEVLDHKTVILDLSRGNYFALNQTGSRIWSLIQDEKDAVAITQAIATEYGQDPVLVERDLNNLIAELQQRGLLHVEAS